VQLREGPGKGLLVTVLVVVLLAVAAFIVWSLQGKGGG
jgi:hypothetical protein